MSNQYMFEPLGEPLPGEHVVNFILDVFESDMQLVSSMRMLQDYNTSEAN